MITNDDIEHISTLGFELVNLRPGSYSQYKDCDLHIYDFEQLEQAIKHTNTLCIDLDTKKGVGSAEEQIKAFESYFNLKDCLAIATKSGGRHYLFQSSPTTKKFIGLTLEIDDVSLTFDVITGNNLSFLRLSDPSKEYTMLAPEKLNIEKLASPPIEFIKYISSVEAKKKEEKSLTKSVQKIDLNIEEVCSVLKTIALIHKDFNSFAKHLQEVRGNGFYSSFLTTFYLPIFNELEDNEKTRVILISHFFKHLEKCDYNLVRTELNKMKPTGKKSEGITINSLYKYLQEVSTLNNALYKALYEEERKKQVLESFDFIEKEKESQVYNNEDDEEEEQQLAKNFYAIVKEKTKMKNELAKNVWNELKKKYPNSKMLAYFEELWFKEVYPNRVIKLADPEEYACYEEMIMILWLVCSTAVGNTYEVNVNNTFKENKVCSCYLMLFDRSSSGKGRVSNFVGKITTYMTTSTYAGIRRAPTTSSGQSVLTDCKESLLNRNIFMLEEECSNSKIMKILNSTANEMDDMQKVLNTSFTAVYADAVIPGYSSRTGTDTKDIKLVSANYFGVSQPFHVPNLKQLNTGLYGRFHFYFPSALPETAFKEFKATAKNRFLSVEETLKEDENKMTNIFKESESFFIDSSDIEFSTDDEKKIYNEKIIYIGELLNDVSLGVLGNDEYTRLVKSTRQNNIIPYSYEEFSKYGENFELYEDYEFNEFVNRQKEFMKKTTSSEDEEKPQKTKEPNYKKIFQEVITNESFQNKLEEKYKQRFNLRIDVDLVGFLNHIEKKNDYEKDKHQRLLHKIVYMLSAFSIVLEKEKMLSAQTARCSSALYLAVTKLIFTQMEYFFDITTITGKADIAEADFREENKRQLQKALSLAKNFIAYRVRKALARSQDKTTISFQSFSKAAGIEDLTLKKRQELAEQAFLEVQKKLKKDKKIKATMSWSYKSPTCKLRVDDDFVITIS